MIDIPLKLRDINIQNVLGVYRICRSLEDGSAVVIVDLGKQESFEQEVGLVQGYLLIKIARLTIHWQPKLKSILATLIPRML